MKKLFRIILAYIRQTDLWLWILCVGLSGFSALLLLGIVDSRRVPDVGMRTVMVQCLATGLGCFCALCLSKIDYHTLAKLWKLHIPAAYGLVLLTFFIGEGTQERLADKSWIRLPFVNLTIQPAEFLKLSFILAFAYHLNKVREYINRPVHLLLLCVHGAIPVLLIHMQGDDGTALVFAAIFAAMLFAAGLNLRYVFGAIFVAVVGFPFLWFRVLSDYQKNRFLILFDPLADPQGDYYQQYWAKLAIGSGKVWGKGIFSEDHRYVPMIHNDFIIAFIGESLGYVGCMAVLVVLTILFVKILVNSRLAEDFLGQMICIGVFAMFSAQAVINIGMCISLLPVIGITLPFLSYGGSSVLASYLGMGFILSVYMRNPKNLFSD